MELPRPRKMELLHTPKLDLLRMMRENSFTVEDVIFLFVSNKLVPADIRMNSPSICDKLLTMFLRQMSTERQATTISPMAA
ncbi:MAG: hypothetical protein ACJ70V_07005 [Nitrososphaera sp.]